jgi:prepilin-type N-terminal cleavage/methylation domain-containing protein
MFHTRERRAFTLIELLVVISIVALLVALLLPSLARAKFRAETVNCLARMKQSSLAVLLYGNDYSNRTPALVGAPYDYGTWIPLVAPYLGAAGLTQANYYFSPQLKPLHCTTNVRGGTYTYGKDGYFFCTNWSLRTTWYYNAQGTVDAANSDNGGRRIDRLGLRTFLLIDGGYILDSLHVPFVNQLGVNGNYNMGPGVPPLYPNHEGWGNSMSLIDGSARFYATQQQWVEVGTREGSPWMYKSAWVRPSWGIDTAIAD